MKTLEEHMDCVFLAIQGVTIKLTRTSERKCNEFRDLVIEKGQRLTRDFVMQSNITPFFIV